MASIRGVVEASIHVYHYTNAFGSLDDIERAIGREQPMSRLLLNAKKFVAKYVTRKEEGATLAEYGLLLALIAVVCITAIAALGTQISSMFQSLSTSV